MTHRTRFYCHVFCDIQNYARFKEIWGRIWENYRSLCQEITDSFDYSLFKTLVYKDCNVCVDGCDEIIQITENEITHELRYSFSDEVEGMESLRQKLSELLNELGETS